MQTISKLPCVILAGGKSRRFGVNKAVAMLDDAPLFSHVYNRLAPQTSLPIVINTNDSTPFSASGIDCIADRLEGDIGPLAGLHAAIAWAAEQGAHAVITCSVDTPFLPKDYISRLEQETAPAIATRLGRRHSICGLWPIACLSRLEQDIARGVRAVGQWAEHCAAATVAFDGAYGIDPFFNINTAEDLERASNLLTSGV